MAPALTFGYLGGCFDFDPYPPRGLRRMFWTDARLPWGARRIGFSARTYEGGTRCFRVFLHYHDRKSGRATLDYVAQRQRCRARLSARSQPFRCAPSAERQLAHPLRRFPSSETTDERTSFPETGRRRSPRICDTLFLIRQAGRSRLSPNLKAVWWGERLFSSG
jgi:hypothetical protein